MIGNEAIAGNSVIQSKTVLQRADRCQSENELAADRAEQALPLQSIEEYRGDRFQPGAVLRVKATDDGAIDVEYSYQVAIFHQRNDNFRRRGAITGDMAGKLVDIGHNAGLPRRRRGSKRSRP